MDGFLEYLAGLGLSKGSVRDDISRINMIKLRNIDYKLGEEYAKVYLQKSNLSQSFIDSCLRLCRRYEEYIRK